MSDEAQQRAADQEWLRLEVRDDGLRATVTLDEIHLAPAGRLYGGAATALMSTLIEAAAGRRLVWSTTQFVGAGCYGDRLELQAEVVATGKRTSQVGVRAYVKDRLVLAAIGAAGDPEPDIPDMTVPTPPSVPGADACPSIRFKPMGEHSLGLFAICEQRDASEGHSRRFRRWMRIPGRPITRPALLGLAGDFVPPIVMSEIGERGAGTSLDNTIRVGIEGKGEWVLIDGLPELAAGGYGHGSVRIWSEDGLLLATASQTAALWRSLR